MHFLRCAVTRETLTSGYTAHIRTSLVARSLKESRHGGCRDRAGPAPRARRPAPRNRIDRPLVGLDGLDHRIGLALRRPGGPDRRRAGGDHLLGDRRGGHLDPRPRPRRARRHVPRLRRVRSVPALCIRRCRGRIVRVVLVPAGRDRGADRGRGRHRVRRPLQLGRHLAERGRDASLAVGDHRRRALDGSVHVDQLPRRPGIGIHQ
jgi:hypothetical protein